MLALVMVAVVVAVAQPAGAVDDGFLGRYSLIAREKSRGTCPTRSFGRHVGVVDVNETVREIDPVHSTLGAKWRFRYVTGARSPWRTEGGWFVLRYSPRTDSAVGHMHGIQGDCRWHVKLVRSKPKG